jgi:hypothetical protein
MTTVPNDECIKVSTAMSSSKRVYPGRGLILPALRLPWHLHRVDHPTGVKNRETNEKRKNVKKSGRM